MLKKLSIYMTIAAALAACSDEDYVLPNGIGEDGSLEISFAVPEMQSVVTRADEEIEDNIASLTMLVYSNNQLAQKQDFTNITPDEEGYFSLTANINPNLRGKSDLAFRFVANYNVSSLSLGSNLSALNVIEYATVLNGENFPMIGQAALADLTSGNTVGLMRNAAKVTVTNNGGTAAEPKEGTTKYPFSVYSTASNVSLTAGINQTTSLGEATAPSISGTVGSGERVYVHPTRNGGVEDTQRPFVILKGAYEGQNYFYRVDFRNKTKDGTITDLDIQANHWYKFIVKEITGVGSGSPAEASANPSPMIEVEIYDVSPKSFNMITDGSRELGVPHQLSYSGNAEGTADVYVKLYSPDSSEYPAATLDAWKGKLVSSTYKWLSLTGVEESTEAAITGTPSGGAAATKGKVYHLTVTFGKTASPGTLEASFNVDWMGLHRSVPVKWTREFRGADLCDVKLTIKGAGGTTVVSEIDYWNFLANTLKGATPAQNGDSIRNEGLHFPVMYGESGSLWTYNYEVTFKDLMEGAAYDWKIVKLGMNDVTVSATKGTNKTGSLTVNVAKPGNNWTYEKGRLELHLAPAGSGDYTKYSIDLYHTGFFHNHDTSTKKYAVANSDAGGWFYYEVLTDDAGYHWLDRNLGATASGLYIEATGDVAYHGSKKAGGAYYYAAGYNDGGEPKMYTDLCPPGFEIPREEGWNSVRNSSKFDKSQIGNYYNACLTSANGMPIYFSKSRYYGVNGVKTGESRAGYYWSGTAASGLEKDQIGNWLRCLNISGNITTYINGQVKGRKENGVPSNGYAMNVRCVGKTTASTGRYRTHFNVIGATNVYLYSEKNGVRYPVTSWPGTPIGNSATMTGNNMMNFSYESPTTRPEDFYVIFSFKDANGKIHTVSKAADGSTIYSTDQNPSYLNGWKVVGDDFQGTETACGGTWKVENNQSAMANVLYNGISAVTIGSNKIRIYCWNFEGWDNIYVESQSDDGGSYTQKVKGTLIQEYYPQLYSFEIDSNTKRVRFGETQNITSSFYGDGLVADKAYFINSNQTVNALKSFKPLEDGKMRIVIRPVFFSTTNATTLPIDHYIYRWKGSETSGGPDKEKMQSLLGGKFFYYDVPKDIDGLLFTDGKFNSNENKGHQTQDFKDKLNQYEDGKLLESWYGETPAKKNN